MLESSLTTPRLLSLTTLLLTLAACAADDADDAADGPHTFDASDAEDDSSTDKPHGADACRERYFSTLNFECSTIDCGEALTCTSDWDCLSCADRCEAASCGSDADCVAEYGDLCSDVEWRCEPQITAENLRCSVHAIGESRCGDAECTTDESCDSCQQDCGYCPGTAPAMAACTSDSDCESGTCEGWCVATCTDVWDCVGDGGGVLFGECLLAADESYYCFPSCDVDGGCAQYPGTSCTTATSTEDREVQVCSG